MLEKCAATSLSSKLVSLQKDFFAKMVVDAVMSLDDLLPLSMIGIKKVSGGALEVRIITHSSPDQSIAFCSAYNIYLFVSLRIPNWLLVWHSRKPLVMQVLRCNQKVIKIQKLQCLILNWS